MDVNQRMVKQGSCYRIAAHPWEQSTCYDYLKYKVIHFTLYVSVPWTTTKILL